ncbi:MAG: alpha/beta hydrolase [Nitrospirae bacterium]|nr:alpha/beta hydrolase [Nitrospirota bacterium]
MTLLNAMDRAAGRAVVFAVNNALPRVARLGTGLGYRIHRNIAYRDTGDDVLHLDVVAPKDEGPFPVVVGFHGGAWIVGVKENLHQVAAALARRGFLVVVPQYRLAPRYAYPACVEDVAAVLKWVRSNVHRYGGNPERVGVFGDSAGGHLSAYAAVLLSNGLGPVGSRHNGDLAKVSAAVHWYGVFDFRKFARVPYRRTEQILHSVFGPEGPEREAAMLEASPRMHLDRARVVPPTLLFCGTMDPLFTQSRSYARDLVEQGRDVHFEIFPGSIHGFMNLWWQSDSRRSIAMAADWFKDHLNGLL